MDVATSQFVAKVVDLRISKDDADVTLNCEDKVIEAHAYILEIRQAGLQRKFLNLWAPIAKETWEWTRELYFGLGAN